MLGTEATTMNIAMSTLRSLQFSEERDRYQITYCSEKLVLRLGLLKHMGGFL